MLPQSDQNFIVQFTQCTQDRPVLAGLVLDAACYRCYLLSRLHSKPQRMEIPQGLILAVFLFITLIDRGRCILFPRESESRELKDISGLWNFRADNSSNRNLGFEKEWWQKPLRQVVKVKFT